MICLGGDHDHAGVFAGGNKAFVAVNDKMVAVPDGRCRLTDRVRTRLRFGQGKCAYDFSGRKRLQKPLLLHFRAKPVKAFADNGILNGHYNCCRGARIGDLGKGKDITDSVGAGAVILKRDHHPHETKRSHFL